MTFLFGRNPVVRAVVGVVLIVAGLALGMKLITVAGGVLVVIAGVQALAATRGRSVIGGKGDGRSLP